MGYDQGQSSIVAFKAQSAKGTPESGGSGKVLRITPSPGLRLAKQIILSNEARRDGQRTRGRHGSRSVSAAYNGELSLTTYDELFRAAFRGVETATATRTYDNSAGLTSLEVTGAGEITQVGTTTLLGVVAKGDLIKLGSMSTAANNDVWCRVTNVTATVVSLAGSPLTVQAADTACTLTVAKKLLMPTGTPTERYFTIDEYYQDSDISYRGQDLKVCGFSLSAQPNEHVTVSFRFMGLDMDDQTTGSSPTLTSPTATTSLPLVLADGTIRINGTDYADISALTMDWDMGGTVPGVHAPTPPDVFLNNGRLTGTISGMRDDAAEFDLFDAETKIEIFTHMIEVGDSNPKDFVSWYVGNAAFNSYDPSGPGAEGPVFQNLNWVAGVDEAGNPSDQTTLKICSSSAAVA